MKQGFDSLMSLAAELTRQAEAKKDYVAPSASMSVAFDNKTPVLNFAGETAPMTDLAVRQIDEYLGIPAKYADKMRVELPELWKLNADQWLQRANGDKRLVRTLDGNVRALLSDSYKRIDNYEVADTALSVLRDVPGLRVVSTAITESRLYIKAVSSEVKGEVVSRRVGDMVEAGVMISNSEVGLGAVSIKPFAHFLVCTNGMVRDKSSLRAAHVGRKRDESLEGLLSDQTKRLEDAAVLSKVKDVIQSAFDLANFQRWLNTMSEQSGQMIQGDPVKALEVLGTTFGVSKDEQSSIMRHLIMGGDLSRYGLTNAVTRTAEDVGSYDRATELETIGGRIVDLAASDWRTIAAA